MYTCIFMYIHAYMYSGIVSTTHIHACTLVAPHIHVAAVRRRRIYRFKVTYMYIYVHGGAH